jgi:hypothetical protein
LASTRAIGLHTRAQLPILMHIETDRLGVKYSHDPSH